MFRTTLFSIVLVLSAGQNAVLLCKAWCDPGVAAASGCHDRGGATDSPRLVDVDRCDEALLGLAFLKEDVQRSEVSSSAYHSIAVPHYQFAHSTTDGRPRYEPSRLPRFDERPLETALRI